MDNINHYEQKIIFVFNALLNWVKLRPIKVPELVSDDTTWSEKTQKAGEIEYFDKSNIDDYFNHDHIGIGGELL